MPTYETEDAFLRGYRELTPAQREKFLRARDLMMADMKAGAGFRKGLRVKGFRGKPGAFEMTWAPDGRALFRYGPSVKDSEPHVIWLRIGTHSIFDER